MFLRKPHDYILVITAVQWHFRIVIAQKLYLIVSTYVFLLAATAHFDCHVHVY